VHFQNFRRIADDDVSQSVLYGLITLYELVTLVGVVHKNFEAHVFKHVSMVVHIFDFVDWDTDVCVFRFIDNRHKFQDPGFFYHDET
jgi:hypothetical protein